MSKPRYRPDNQQRPGGPRRWLLIAVVIMVVLGLVVSMAPPGAYL